MEIPYGHRMKILKKIKEFKTIRNKNENEPSPHLNQINSTFSETGVGMEIDWRDLKDNENNSIDKNIIETDEEKQHRLFREAVDQFRKTKKPESNNKISKNKINITTIREVDEVIEFIFFKLFFEKLFILTKIKERRINQRKF